MGFRMAAQAFQGAAFAAHGFERLFRPLQHGRQCLFQARDFIRGAGQQLQAAEELLRAGCEEGGTVDEHEILRACGLRAIVRLQTGQLRARYADHFDGHATRHGHLVVKHVARDGGDAHDHIVACRRGEQALRQLGRQAIEYLQAGAQQAVAFRMHAARGMARVGIGSGGNAVQGLQQLRARLLLAVLFKLVAWLVGQGWEWNGEHGFSL